MTIQQMIKMLKDAVRRIEALEQAVKPTVPPEVLPAVKVRRGRQPKPEVTEPEPVATEPVATESKAEI